MNKQWSTLLLLALSTNLPMMAYDFACDDILYTITSDSTVEVSGTWMDWPPTTIRIPESVDQYGYTYKVTAVGDSAFFQQSSIKHMTLPKTIRRIGRRSFAEMSSLKYVNLPEGLEELAPLAFYQSSLMYANVPGSLKEVGDSTFLRSRLTLLTLHEGTARIGKGAFANCPALRSLHLPKSIRTIDDMAFSECPLRWIHFECSDVEMGTNVFSPIQRDTHMIEGESWWNHVMVSDMEPKPVSAATFKDFDCPLYVPAGTAEAYGSTEGWQVFDDKSTHEAKAIVEGIPDTWPVGVNASIEQESSIEVTALDENIPSRFNRAKEFGSNGWNWAAEFGYGDTLLIAVHQSPNMVIEGIDINGVPTEFEQQEEGLLVYRVEPLQDELFINVRETLNSEYGRQYLRLDKVRYMVTSDHTAAAVGCDYDTKEAVIPETIESYTVTAIADNAFYNRYMLERVELPPSLKKISQQAFLQTGIMSIEIPEAVDTIGELAFGGCTNLSRIVIPESSQLRHIGKNAFFTYAYYPDSTLLQLVTLPAGLTEIKEPLFSEQDAPLALLSYAETPAALDSTVLAYPLTVVYVRQKDVEAYLAAPYWRDHEIVGLDDDSLNSLLTSTLYQDADNAKDMLEATIVSIKDTVYYGERKAFEIQVRNNGQQPVMLARNVICFPWVDAMGIMECQVGQDTSADGWLNAGEEKRITYIPYFGEHQPLGVQFVYYVFTEGKFYKRETPLQDITTGLLQTWADRKDDSQSLLVPVRYYSVDGHVLPAPVRGINIIRLSDGSTKKVLIR